MSRKIVNPRIHGQSLPTEITHGQMLAPRGPGLKPQEARKDFTNQKKVVKVYRWK